MNLESLRYKGIPLFGKDSSPHNTSEFLAIAATALFWIVVFIFMLFAKPFKKKPEYKTVQIVLSSTPVKKAEKSAAASSSNASAAKQADAAAPKSESSSKENAAKQAPKTDSKPVQKSAEAAQKKTEPKTQPAQSKPVEKSAPAPVKTQPQTQTTTKAPAPVAKQPEVYAKSTEELMAEQFAQKKQTKNVDWDSMFADDEPQTETSDSQPEKTVTQKTSFEGTSGTVSSAASESSTSKADSSSASNQNASSSTLNALGSLKNTTFKGSAGNSLSSEVSAKVSSGNGKSQMEMSDGSVRTLIEPAEPVINISEENAKLIDSTRNVVINFDISESGNVMKVTIQPSAIIPLPVQTEITNQIKKWRFEAANFTSTAKFQYSIIKK